MIVPLLVLFLSQRYFMQDMVIASVEKIAPILWPRRSSRPAQGWGRWTAGGGALYGWVNAGWEDRKGNGAMRGQGRGWLLPPEKPWRGSGQGLGEIGIGTRGGRARRLFEREMVKIEAF